jgi:hypothetical protein
MEKYNIELKGFKFDPIYYYKAFSHSAPNDPEDVFLTFCIIAFKYAKLRKTDQGLT